MFVKVAFLLVLGLAFEKVYADEPQKIVGGSDAKLGEFPYQVSLNYHGLHVCGGTIVSDRHIVTAAHCVDRLGNGPFKNFHVETGMVKLDSPQRKVYDVKSIRVHPEYKNEKAHSWVHDAAVITLTEPIEFNANQKPIPLATSDPPEKAPLILSGWGQLKAHGQYPNHLQKANIYHITNQQCQKAHGNIRIFDTQLCGIQVSGIGACQGDSGGPLAYKGQLVGIVSWVVPCARGAPDVFTRVSLYDSFFSEALKA